MAVSVQWAQAEALTATQEGHTAGVAGAPLAGGGRLDNDLCFGREPKWHDLPAKPRKDGNFTQ